MKRAFALGTAAVLLSILSILAVPGQNSSPPAVTFSKDVAPILYEHCVYCHRPGEVAPFSMVNYATTRPWARSIKEQVLTRRMPPWYLDPRYGGFRNVKDLKPQDIVTLAAWVDGGAKEGDPRDLPPAPRFGSGWEIGRPDLIARMKEPFKVPASGVVAEVIAPTDYEFPEDTWIQAIEIRPGSRRVVHQALAMLGPSGLATSVHLYAPGLPATIFREGYGRFIPKGARLYLRMHYNAIGQEISDQTEVGFRFAVRPVHTEVRTGIADANPPVATPLDSHQAFTTFPLSLNARIQAFRPHMAVRGDSASATLVLPDRSRRTLLSVAGWFDNWEYSYILSRPVEVPQGAGLDYATSRALPPGTGANTHLLLFDWTPVNAANIEDLESILLPGNPLFTTGLRVP
jgi:hypothetical protein